MSLVDDFTARQRQAINSALDQTLVLAGPGSGKTRTLTHRAIQTAQRAKSPDAMARVAILTFTNSVAREIEARLDKFRAPEWIPFGERQLDELGVPIGFREVKLKPGFVGTLHAFALRGLRQYGGPFGYGERTSVISPEAGLDLLESKRRTLGIKLTTKELVAQKRQGRRPRGVRLSPAELVVAAYFDELREGGVVDYDAILSEFRDMIDPAGPEQEDVRQKLCAEFSDLLVDEVQDSAPIDWEIYELLPCERKFLVGDTDQAIYSFRGGRVDLAVQRAKGAPDHVITLEENFRSHEEICEAAQRLIEHNLGRYAKRTLSTKGPGGRVQVIGPARNSGHEHALVEDEIRRALDAIPGENDATKPEEIAVIARSNEIADGFRKHLKAVGVPVADRTVDPLPDDWALARSFVEFATNPENDSLAFFYLVALYQKKGASPASARAAAHADRMQATAAGKSLNRAKIGLARFATAKAALEALGAQKLTRESMAIASAKFRELASEATSTELALALSEAWERVTETGVGVSCLTIHAAKGREFDRVFLVGFEDEICPSHRTERDLEEERRLAYVAVTRARIALTISYSLTRRTRWGETQNRTPSRFIPEILG